MSLFGFGKKKEVNSVPVCACNENSSHGICCDETATGICCIKVLGSGCKSCQQLYENTQEAVKSMGLDLKVEYVTDMEKIVGYGVMSTPALVVNEKVISMGKILKAEEVQKLFHKLGF